jgi:hypothetical protein
MDTEDTPGMHCNFAALTEKEKKTENRLQIITRATTGSPSNKDVCARYCGYYD